MVSGAEKPDIKFSKLFFYALIFVVAPVFTYLTGRYLDGILKLPTFPPWPFNLISGFAVFLAGLALGVKSTRILYLNGKGLPWGELEDSSQSKELVVEGPYKYTRNPIVLGYSMLPCGMGLMFRSPGMTIFVTVLLIVINFVWVKYREEPVLENRFGQKYREYRENTPFILPRLSELLPDIFPGRGGEGSINFYAVFNISSSLIGLFLLAFLTTNQKYAPKETVLGGLYPFMYTSICLLGLVAGVNPSILSKPLQGNEIIEENPLNIERGRFRGHHPDCQQYKSHVLVLWNRTLCAGCTGLSLGAGLAIIGVFAYQVMGASSYTALVLFWLGFVLVFLGLLQHHIDLDNPYLHLILNVILVLGTLFLFIGVDRLKGGLIELYLVGLNILWINTRIELSHNDHTRVCRRCSTKDCDIGYR